MRTRFSCLALAALLAGAALAEDEAKDETEVQTVEKMDGKDLFKNFCKISLLILGIQNFYRTFFFAY